MKPEPLNTHGVTLNFGRHKGELITRVPVSYLRWMINENSQMSEYAQAEFERRGDTMPKVEVSGHAIDKASLRVRKIWNETRGADEGLYSWLTRMVLEALEHGEPLAHGQIEYNGMKLAIEQGAVYPSLKTIMAARRKSGFSEADKEEIMLTGMDEDFYK